MKIIYHLSNAQRKELLVRGAPLQIALPAPPIEIDDCVEWAKTMLPTDLRSMVVEAEIEEIRVSPGHGASGLAGIIGSIQNDDAGIWTIPVVVVIVQLKPPSHRNAKLPVQWPVDVILDGVSLLERMNKK